MGRLSKSDREAARNARDAARDSEYRRESLAGFEDRDENGKGLAYYQTDRYISTGDIIDKNGKKI